MTIKYKECKDCGDKLPAKMISRRGLCPDCGRARQEKAYKQISRKRGRIYDKYRRGRSKMFKHERKEK